MPRPTKSVTSPSTCISVRLSRSGMRAPASRPTAVPARMAPTLIQVPEVRAKRSSMERGSIRERPPCGVAGLRPRSFATAGRALGPGPSATGSQA